MIDFLKKTLHLPKFARGGIIENHIVDVECDPPEFVVNHEKLMEFISNTESFKKTELKPCPFCGGYVGVMERIVNAIEVYTKAECTGCHMVFEYSQYFSISKQARVSNDDPFETTWNRRVNNEF